MFRNAYEGIKKIRIAEIISFAASVVSVIGLVMLLFGAKGAARETRENLLAIFGFIAIAVLIALLVSFVLSLAGLNRARKDEPLFNTAFMLTIGAFAVSVVSGFFSSSSVASSIIAMAANLLMLAATVFVVKGIISLANKLKAHDVAAKGASLLNLIIGVQVLSIVASIFALIFGGIETGAIAGILLNLVSSLLTVVGAVLYISLLTKAQKMLE